MSKEAVAAEVVQFKGFDVTPVKGGYKGKKEIVTSLFKEKGITEEVTEKVFGAISEIHRDVEDFCKDRVCIEKKNIELVLPVTTGVTIDAKVKMRANYPGMNKYDGEGNLTDPAVPFTKWGVVDKGMSFNFTKDDAELNAKIATDVQAACEAFCKEQDAKAEKK